MSSAISVVEKNWLVISWRKPKSGGGNLAKIEQMQKLGGIGVFEMIATTGQSKSIEFNSMLEKLTNSSYLLYLSHIYTQILSILPKKLPPPL